MKILIGIPCYGDPANQVYEDHIRLMYYLGRRYPEIDFYLAVKTKSEQFRARNAIISSSLSVGADYILMIDDDMIFDTHSTYNIECGKVAAYEFLHKMLAHKKEIVGAMYVTRGGAYEPVMLKKHGWGYRKFTWDEVGDGLIPVDSVGGGAMLIDTILFRKGGIKFPVFEPELQWGTDIQLCRKAQELGYQPYVDTTIHLGHLSRERQVATMANSRQLNMDRLSGGTREFAPVIQEAITEKDLENFDKL